jgi:hypothetical protein
VTDVLCDDWEMMEVGFRVDKRGLLDVDNGLLLLLEDIEKDDK